MPPRTGPCRVQQCKAPHDVTSRRWFPGPTCYACWQKITPAAKAAAKAEQIAQEPLAEAEQPVAEQLAQQPLAEVEQPAAQQLVEQLAQRLAEAQEEGEQLQAQLSQAETEARERGQLRRRLTEAENENSEYRQLRRRLAEIQEAQLCQVCQEAFSANRRPTLTPCCNNFGLCDVCVRRIGGGLVFEDNLALALGDRRIVVQDVRCPFCRETVDVDLSQGGTARLRTVEAVARQAQAEADSRRLSDLTAELRRYQQEQQQERMVDVAMARRGEGGLFDGLRQQPCSSAPVWPNLRHQPGHSTPQQTQQSTSSAPAWPNLRHQPGHSAPQQMQQSTSSASVWPNPRQQPGHSAPQQMQQSTSSASAWPNLRQQPGHSAPEQMQQSTSSASVWPNLRQQPGHSALEQMQQQLPSSALRRPNMTLLPPPPGSFLRTHARQATIAGASDPRVPGAEINLLALVRQISAVQERGQSAHYLLLDLGRCLNTCIQQAQGGPQGQWAAWARSQDWWGPAAAARDQVVRFERASTQREERAESSVEARVAKAKSVSERALAKAASHARVVGVHAEIARGELARRDSGVVLPANLSSAVWSRNTNMSPASLRRRAESLTAESLMHIAERRPESSSSLS